jgi:hypothetical protein
MQHMLLVPADFSDTTLFLPDGRTGECERWIGHVNAHVRYRRYRLCLKGRVVCVRVQMA